MKLLIDTNIIIGLEDAGIVQKRFSDLIRGCQENHVEVFVHEASIEDINRDANLVRREATLSRIQKFVKLKGVATPSPDELASTYGPNKKPNDLVDAKLLHAVKSDVVDFLISEDSALHKRAKLAGIDTLVFTVAEALTWLHREYRDAEIVLPSVQPRQAYSLDPKDPIFGELKESYPPFDDWFKKVRKEHRDCWVVEDSGQIAGVIIRKDEKRAEAKTVNLGPKIMKICTFKVAEPFRGQRLGEQLLKQALWHVQVNNYDLVYLTVFADKQPALVRLLEDYGFVTTKFRNGEAVMEKVVGRGTVTLQIGETALSATRRTYPRFLDDDASVEKFVIPIHSAFHVKLFPEFQLQAEEPGKGTGKPGNTIEKVYLCRSPTRSLKAGDVLFFYITARGNGRGRQTIATVGVVKSVRYSGDLSQLKKWTAKRSVFSDAELDQMLNIGSGPLMVIDFLLIGHCEAAIPLPELRAAGVLNSAPQSLVKLSAERYAALKKMVKLGFEN
jgi:ribosomal protein S18 acetylase RimI-like enzyme